jgi:hypothetical protein
MAQGVQEKVHQQAVQYNSFLTDLEQWLITVKATFSTDLQPASPQTVKDQLLACEVSILK